MTGGRDRTVEFQSVVKYAEAKNPFRRKSYPKSPMLDNNFVATSKKISKDLANTIDKLESLQLLIEKADEQSYDVSFNQLSTIVKQDLNDLNRKIAQLQQYLKHKVNMNKQRSTHSNSIIVTLQSKLVQMSAHFKMLLEVKQQKMNKSDPVSKTSVGRSHQEGHNNYFASNESPRSKIPSQQSHPNDFNQHLQHDTQFRQQHSQQHNQQFNVRNSSWSSRQTNMYKKYDHYDENVQQTSFQDSWYSQQQQQPQHSQHHKQQQQMLRQRFVQEEKPDEMVNIEQTIVELGGIFHQLATMVHEQGETVCRIDSHVDESQLNVEVAHTELLKYLRGVTATRAFLIKVFIVLIFFVVFFSYFYG